MITLKKFKQYTPNKSETEKFALHERGVGFLRDENGLDWYDAQALFASDTVKILYDEAGVVTNMSSDVSMLYPDTMNIVELPRESIPDDLQANRQWLWRDNQFVNLHDTPEEAQKRAQLEKERLIQLATNNIAPLEDGEILNELTENENEMLAAWRRFRLEVSRVDLSLAPNIDWPHRPDGG